MTLLDAPVYDNRHEKRNRNLKIAAAVIVVVAICAYVYWPFFIARRTVDRFMDALVRKNYQEAYYIWQPDVKMYPMDAFMQDWGPGSRWGIIQTYHIDQLGRPPGSGTSSGLVALVAINGIRTDQARIWIENHSHLLSFYQF